ncbi:hypothetical protein C4552_02185 [Candidatus Parcubacteria bacterium]|nr:MAG: hypothetical protein C4552_02185 [Candidatus Parcubacteria bacterium]
MSHFFSTYILRRSAAPAAVRALTVPALGMPRFLFRPEARFWTSAGALGVIAASVVIYVAVVQAMMFSGEAVLEARRTLEALEQDRDMLEAEIARQRAPARLEAAARAHGMVGVDHIRYLSGEHSVALTR